MDDVTVASRPTAAVPPVPTATQLRRRLRRSRHAHHAGSLADGLTDAYLIVLIVALYGWSAVNGIRSFLASPAGQLADAGERYWIVVAVALVGAGLAWHGLRVVGPLLVTPATQTWAVSSPVDRRALLRPRFWALILGAGAGVGLLGLAAAIAGGAGGATEVAWSAGTGAAGGAAVAALGVIAQAARGTPSWARLLGHGLVGTGVAIALGVIASHACRPSVALCAGLNPSQPSIPLTVGAGLLTLPVAIAAAVLGARALARIDRAALTGGVEFAYASTAAVLLVDPSMLTSLVESRRWRSVGRVRSRPLGRGQSAPRWPAMARVRVLVRAELRRRMRDRSALAVWAASLLGLYAVAVALPSIEASAHLILAYLAANRLASGLRVLGRSPGLRRSLGGRDGELKLAHLVVPGIAGIIWYLAALPAVRTFGWIDVLLMAGIILAVYRAATRPPIRHGGPVAETPFGLIPVDLLRQLFRGPDVVGVLVLVELLTRPPA